MFSQELLLKVSNEIKKNNKDKSLKGEFFNVFDVVGIGSDEVKMCKVLAEIINPHGSHSQEITFLKSFCDIVLGVQIEDDELTTVKVYTEYPTDFNRRIDIVIVSKYRFIPIEVKIYAEDQKRQCRDYYDFAVKQKKNFNTVYYLTLDGHFPQCDGSIGLTPEINGYKEVTAISFKVDVLKWLNFCLNEENVQAKSSVFAVMKQYTNTIERLCGLMDAEITNKITDMISKSADTMRTACSINENINIAKEKMLLKFFAALEEKINDKKPELIQLTNKFDYKFDNYSAIKNFYKYNRSTYPALTYKYKKIDDTKEIWLRIEVDYNLFVGFVLAENNENPQKQILEENDIKKLLQKFEPEIDGWWAYWEYLPIDDNDAAYTPNFKIHNDIYYNLFDDDYFDKFIDDCVERILNIVGK